MKTLATVFFVSVLSILLACGSSLANQAFIIDTLTEPETDFVSPQVASSDDGLTMVAYTSNGVVAMSFVVTQLVPTHPDLGTPWPPAVTLNSGGGAKLCWSRDGFTAAVSSGPVMLLYQSDLQGTWDHENYEMMDPGGELLGIDLWGAPSDAAGPAVFLTWQSSGNPQEPGARVYFASRSDLGWSEPELVVEVTEQWPHPQVTWSIGPAGPLPTIFYLDGPEGDGQLMSTTRDFENGWSEPVEVPGDGESSPTPLGGEFDVVSPFDLNRHILGLGPQPTCPCGSLHHQYFTPGAGWHPAEEITVEYDHFDWPQCPRLGAESDGTVHAFWYQLASSEMLEPHQKTLEYWIWDGGSWGFAGDFLADQSGGPLGSRVALDVSPVGGFPVLAWTWADTLEGVPQPIQVRIARPQNPADVPEDQVPRPEITLKAWPNPFNPLVHLDFELMETGQVRLEIFDARGRLISRLIDEVRSGGDHSAVWNGQDLEGRHQPSGMYFAKLVTARGAEVQKLVLAR